MLKHSVEEGRDGADVSVVEGLRERTSGDSELFCFQECEEQKRCGEKNRHLLVQARKEHAPCVTQRRAMSKMGLVRVVDPFREGTCGDGEGFCFGEREEEVTAIKTGTHLYVAIKERCAMQGEHSTTHQSLC